MDSKPPVINAWWLGQATVATGGSATVVIDAYDETTPPAQLQVSFDGVNWSSYSATKTVSITGVGYAAITVQVRDQAGNVSQKVLEILAQ